MLGSSTEGIAIGSLSSSPIGIEKNMMILEIDHFFFSYWPEKRNLVSFFIFLPHGLALIREALYPLVSFNTNIQTSHWGS